MSAFTPEALKDEIVNDPTNVGYKKSAPPNDWKGDLEIVDLINLKNLVIDRIAVEMEQLRGDTPFDWFDGLTAEKQRYLLWQTPDSGLWRVTEHMKVSLTGSKLAVDGAAGVSTPADSWWLPTTRTAAIAAILPLIEIAGSRGEVLWVEGTIISAVQVGGAANLVT